MSEWEPQTTAEPWVWLPPDELPSWDDLVAEADEAQESAE